MKTSMELIILLREVKSSVDKLLEKEIIIESPTTDVFVRDEEIDDESIVELMREMLSEEVKLGEVQKE